jgi:hypothetical protein
MKLKFFVFGGGDASVGIGDYGGVVTIEDNIKSRTAEEIEQIRKDLKIHFEDFNISEVNICLELDNEREGLFQLGQELEYYSSEHKPFKNWWKIRKIGKTIKETEERIDKLKLIYKECSRCSKNSEEVKQYGTYYYCPLCFDEVQRGN